MHFFKIKVVHARLVQDHMRHVRQALFHIGHAAAAHDVALVCIAGFPEGRFIDPISLFQHLMCKSEGLEHLHRAACHAIGLPQLQRAGFLLNDDCTDVRKRRQLCSQRQSGRAAANDQHISLGRQSAVCICLQGGFTRVKKRRVTGSKSIEVKLHAVSLAF